jgi:hypothetical protein
MKDVEESGYDLKVLSQYLPEALRNKQKYQDGWHPGRDLNRAPPKYKLESNFFP